jgi:hypothetical protein
MAKKLILSALLLVGSTVLADPADVNLTKTQLDVNFNTMIDAGNVTKNSIQKHIEDQIADSSEEEDSDRSRVLDFVDVEVGIGKEPGVVVDRRFDSVGAPFTFGLIDLKALAKIY